MNTGNDGSNDTSPIDDWQDRAIDAALQEVHGSKPPDLSARVLLALRDRPQGPLPSLRARPQPWLGWLLAAAMLLLSLAGSWWWWTSSTGRGGEEQLIAQIEVAVSDGAVECVETTPTSTAFSTVARGTTGLFTARAGNRLRTAVSSRSQLGPFGIVSTGPHTILEVSAMEFSLKNGVVAASALTLAVVAGVVTWHTLTRTETATAGEKVRLEAAPESPTLVAENARLREQIAALQRQNETLATQAARIAASSPQPAQPEPVAEAKPVAAPVESAPFTDERYDAALAAVDWSLVGNVTHEMGPMLAQLVAELEAGGDMTPALQTKLQALGIKIQELNGQLVKQVPAMLEAGLPGFGPNGSYTHPLVVANTLASTLQAAGRPLDDGQRNKMAGLVRSFSVESQAIADQTREFDLEHLLAEVEMKDRFYKEMSTLLTPDQYSKMYPEGSTDYDGINLFGTGLMTHVYAESVASSGPADFARIASNKLGENLGFDEAGSQAIRAVVERMASASPELWQNKATVAETMLHKMKAGRTPAALRRQLEIMREIQRVVPMTPEQKKKLASMKHILVPIPR